MNREIAVTNKVDQYLIDADKNEAIASFLREKGDKVKAFVKHFPTDSMVLKYLKNKTTTSKNNLLFHISLIESRLPLKLYFDLNGLTNTYLIEKLKKLIDSDDVRASGNALNLALRYKFPAEQPIRIKPVQTNIFNLDSDKKKVVEELMKKVNDN